MSDFTIDHLSARLCPTPYLGGYYHFNLVFTPHNPSLKLYCKEEIKEYKERSFIIDLDGYKKCFNSINNYDDKNPHFLIGNIINKTSRFYQVGYLPHIPTLTRLPSPFDCKYQYRQFVINNRIVSACVRTLLLDAEENCSYQDLIDIIKTLDCHWY